MSPFIISIIFSKFKSQN